MPRQSVTTAGHDAELPDPSVLAAAGGLLLDTATAEVVRAFEAVGIEALLLRGPAIARRLYGPSERRAYVDADLLVSPASFDAAEAVLSSLGFAESRLEQAFARGRPRHAHTWSRAPEITIDIHRTLVGLPADPSAVWDVLVSDTEPMLVEGATVRVPSLPVQGVIIALHAAQHGHELDQPIEDLERAVERLNHDVWRDSAALAGRLHAEQSFAAGLRLVEMGSRLADELGLPQSGFPDARLAGARAFHVAQGLQWLAATPGARAKARFIARKMFPAPRDMRLESRVARKGRAGLAAAYAARAVELLVSSAVALVVMVKRRILERP